MKKLSKKAGEYARKEEVRKKMLVEVDRMDKHRQLWIVTIMALILVCISVYISGRPEVREAETVVVRVEGAGRQPGSIALVNGMRVIDAIEACGGILPEAKMDGVDVSAELIDGQVIRVAPVQAEVSQTKETKKSARKKKKVTVSGPVNINTASITELDRLPGIGPALAKRIIAYREANGRFPTVADIQRVKGIGKKKYEKMKPLIRVE